MLKKTIPLLLFLLFGVLTPVIAQKNYFSYKKIIEGEDTAFSFPIFIPKRDTYSVEKINQFLQISELLCIKHKGQKSIFSNIQYNDGGLYGPKTDISFKIKTNNDRLLSISFDEAASGMTTHYWSIHDNFNAQNGDVIQLEDLFEPASYPVFYKKALKKGLAQLKKGMPKGESRDTYEATYKYDEHDKPMFYIKNNTIYIDHSGQLGKQALFEDIDPVIKMSANEYLPYLNDYGRFIFGVSNDNTTVFHTKSTPQIFAGNIGEAKVLFVFNNYGEISEAEYVYTKYGKGIYCVGTLTGEKLELTEYDADKNKTATITAVFDGETIIGTWQSLDKKTTLPINVKRK